VSRVRVRFLRSVVRSDWRRGAPRVWRRRFGWVVARAWRAFPSVHPLGRDDQVWQARLPRHVFASLGSHDGIEGSVCTNNLGSRLLTATPGSCQRRSAAGMAAASLLLRCHVLAERGG
jgi:hypothetical protein